MGYRDSAIGRQPNLKGADLAVWEMTMIARSYQFDAERIAQNYHCPIELVQAAFHFHEAYREEIDQAVADNNIGYEAMKRQLPGLRLFVVPEEEVVFN